MMKIKNILYISTALLLAGCSSEENITCALTGGEKTPLVINATLGTGTAVTRAEGKDFENNDKLLVYLRHTTGPKAGVPLAYPTTPADQAPRLVTLTKGSSAMSDKDESDGIKETSDLTASYTNTASGTTSALYWDDFSQSTADGSKDLRTSGHGLQSYYGYCYNGGDSYTVGNETKNNITTPLAETAGTLGWTVPTDQSATGGTMVKHADLLWSAEQETVVYRHADARTGDHRTLIIPYTHAMSQVTVTIIANEGFSTTTDPLASTTLTLNAMNTVASLTAPTGGYSSNTPAAVTMYRADNSYQKEGEDAYRRDFTAIVAPGTKLTAGSKLLDITNVEDNNYVLNITDAILATGEGKWLSQLDEKTGAGTYYETKPGVNYHLDVTVNKTKIEVVATIQDWTTVNATGTGEIQFDNDIVALDVTGNSFADNSSFSLFQRGSTVTGTTNDDYAFTTVSTYNTTESKWANSPTIFWPNKSTSYFFRALAKLDGTDANKIISVGTYASDKGTSLSQGTIADGHDILWATTPAHNRQGEEGSYTYDYERGAALAPRTGNVPLTFEHAMSKVTFTLTTTDDEEVTVNNAKVDLTNAKIAVTNISTSGTINIEDGSITSDAKNIETSDLAACAIASQAAPISELIVVPQSLTDEDENDANDPWVIITLNDGTTYKLKLASCVVTTTTTETDSDTGETTTTTVTTPITQWERGMHYQYTIHLEKEQITFRALIKEWEEKQGSGNANLEWD